MSLISKSKLKTVQNCELQFWLELNKPELKKYNSQSLFIFDIGNNFEKKVKALFPTGILINSRKNEKAILETEEKLKDGAVLFEAAFSSNNVIIRADISIFASENLAIIEIKSGTKLKDDYLLDSLIQYWTIINSGKKVSKIEIWTVNNKTKSKDNVKRNDVTQFCIENKKIFDDLIAKTNSLKLEVSPVNPNYGKHCETCPFYNECFKDIKDDPKSVYNLPHFDKKWEALKKKILTLENPTFKEEYHDYWRSFNFQMTSILNNKFMVKKEKLKSLLSNIQQPLNFLDFEAVSYSEPLFKGVRAYENSLIQINYCNLDSCDILLFDDIKKYSKTSIAQKLVNLFNNEGSVFVWDDSLENKILDDLILACKSDEVLYLELINIKDRIIDLSKIFEQCIYKPEFLGKYSQKLMTKLILKSNVYDNSKINDGYQVNKSYLKIVNKETGFEEIKKDLIQYGRNDVLSLKNLTLWCFEAIKK